MKVFEVFSRKWRVSPQNDSSYHNPKLDHDCTFSIYYKEFPTVALLWSMSFSWALTCNQGVQELFSPFFLQYFSSYSSLQIHPKRAHYFSGRSEKNVCTKSLHIFPSKILNYSYPCIDFFFQASSMIIYPTLKATKTPAIISVGTLLQLLCNFHITSQVAFEFS